MEKNIIWHRPTITKLDRYKKNGYRSSVLWFTGLSGSGKSTLANAVDYELFQRGINSYVLDGDNIRHGLNSDLGFSKEDRNENIRRIGEVAKLFVDSGQIVATAFISPFLQDRELVRKMFPAGEFIEIYLHCPIDICENRDPKGLYKKARKGEIPEFTGISSPYEVPGKPEVVISTNKLTIEQSVMKIISYLEERKIL
ncbi:adenylyl-sulfate kinase [Neobacillus kokaensis]|uniref:Adenylyl-sulfate kinase n=1 Tax=Neobacillus kokaensis TaxID=2759023 RepID=A0ABQ3MZG2_9BACI|nr:adenylyl-sulfate kinase [Neobacillus kokaensis]GHH96717.1 putative adenylyl-sulfate kinase [Neobacillus kokaensis]